MISPAMTTTVRTSTSTTRRKRRRGVGSASLVGLSMGNIVAPARQTASLVSVPGRSDLSQQHGGNRIQSRDDDSHEELRDLPAREIACWILLSVFMLQPGEEKIVARRMREILEPVATGR